MFDFTARAEMLYGKENMQTLSDANICLLGIGGVGSYTLEALVRSGVGHITIIDGDIIEKSNMNRQLIALNSTIGQPKVEVAARRAKDINPAIDITPRHMFYLNRQDMDFTHFDYVIDAIDNITAKIALAESCTEGEIPIIAAMGCGNRTDPGKLKLADIYETSGCPLCKIMRKSLREKGINRLKVVYSTENYIRIHGRMPGSTAFVPGTAGLLLAAEVVRVLVGGR